MGVPRWPHLQWFPVNSLIPRFGGSQVYMLNWAKGRPAVRELKRDAVFGHGTPCMRTAQLILLPSD